MRGPALLSAACLQIACGGAGSTLTMPGNQAPVEGPHEIATNCFEIDRSTIDAALASWERLAAGGRLRWIAGSQVPGLNKGKAWPGVSITGIQDGSIYQKMGLHDGDIVYAFNGSSLYAFDTVVNVLSDPSLVEEMEEREDRDARTNRVAQRSGPAAMFSLLGGSSIGDYLSLAILREGKEISINQVLAGTPATACQERPPLRDKEAEEATWTEAERDAHENAEADRAAERVAAFDKKAKERQAVVDGITKMNATTFEISSTISAAQMRAALAGSPERLEPVTKDGKPDGIRLYRVGTSSVYKALGLDNGDLVHTIVGVPVTTLEGMLDELARLPTQKSASIVLTRRTGPVTLVYKQVNHGASSDPR